MSVDPDSRALHVRGEDGGGRYRVDASVALGVQVGEGNTQIIYAYGRQTWADGVVPPPLATVSGVVDSPYRGLNTFEERDAPFFFGREAAATQVLARMSRQIDGSGLLVVSGVSGAGKSSLLRAGVLPRLRWIGLVSIAHASSWPCLLFTPARAPLDELAVRVARLAGADAADVRRGLAALAASWIPDLEGDLTGPGIAIDETAHVKHGDATACVAPQHAGCTGQVENCVTTVFSAYVTASGQAWADFDVYMPDRWARDMPRRRAAGIPADLQFATKPQLAMRQLGRLTAAGLPVTWAAFDEVYGRSEELRKKAAKAGLSYVAIIPCDYQVPLPSGALTRADEAVADAVFERRSCGNGSKGPRYSDWAMTATAIPGQYLLIRRLISRPDQLTFYLCWAPPGRPATMTYFITIAGRRWPAEETFRTGKDTLGWDQCQARSWSGICRHTALAALAQLRAAAIRGALTGSITLPASVTSSGQDASDTADDPAIRDADLLIPLGDAPVPVRGGQSCPPGIAPIKLSIAETVRLAGLARQYAAGLISRARLAFTLNWSARRRRHQAAARWHHYSARLLAITGTG